MLLLLVLIILFIILLVIMIRYGIFGSFEKYYIPIDIDQIPIYIIHQKNKIERYNRLKKEIETYFSNNPVTFIEPISLKIIHKNLNEYLNDKIISQKAYTAITKTGKASMGSLTLPALSLYLTNLEIYKKNHKLPFLILEDDAIFRENFLLFFNKILHQLDEDWDILYLSCHFPNEYHQKIYDKDNLVKIKTRIHGMGAVLYNPAVIHKILSSIYPIDLQIDHDIPDKLILTNKINAYIGCNDNNQTIIFNDNMGGSSTQKN